MKWTALALSLAVAGSGVVVLPATAAAEPSNTSDPALDAAMKHFEQGIALYEEGDYSAALFEFEKAYETKPDHRLLYNVGVTALELKDYAAAIDALTRYLEQGGDDIDKDRRTEVEGQLSTLRSRVGAVTIDCSVEGAEVRVDGKVVATTPLSEPLTLNLGSRTIEVAVPGGGYESYSTDIEVAGGSSTTLAVSLSRSAPPPAVVVEEPDEPETAPSRYPKLRVATFVGLGVTALAGAGLAVAGSLALRADDDLQSENDRFPGDPGALSDAQDRRDSLVLASNVMIGVTAVFAAATIGLGVATAVSKRRQDSARARLQPGGFELRF